MKTRVNKLTILAALIAVLSTLLIAGTASARVSISVGGFGVERDHRGSSVVIGVGSGYGYGHRWYGGYGHRYYRPGYIMRYDPYPSYRPYYGQRSHYRVFYDPYTGRYYRYYSPRPRLDQGYYPW